MSDAELAAKVEEVARERDELVRHLATRQKGEAAVLAGLRARRSAAEVAITRHGEQLARDAAAVVVAERRRSALERGLTPAHRWWARVGEPLVLCLLLLFSVFALLEGGAKPVFLTLVATFSIGGGLRWWAKGPHG